MPSANMAGCTSVSNSHACTTEKILSNQSIVLILQAEAL